MSDRNNPTLVSTAPITSAVVLGLAHVGIAVYLWDYWFDSPGAMLAVKPLNAVYFVPGMFLLGFVPAIFSVGLRVVSPTIVAGALLSLAVLGSMVVGPVEAPRAAPTPFGLYILGWVGVVVPGGISGVVEYRRTRRAIRQ
ncbi:MAG: hypothetical protein ABEJ44_00875 [Halanaeroarchaeum sp.]